jgi:hypothetical protein
MFFTFIFWLGNTFCKACFRIVKYRLSKSYYTFYCLTFHTMNCSFMVLYVFLVLETLTWYRFLKCIFGVFYTSICSYVYSYDVNILHIENMTYI